MLRTYDARRAFCRLHHCSRRRRQQRPHRVAVSRSAVRPRAGVEPRRGDVTPYDVVEESEARTLASADPHNIIRLILPREDDCGPEGPYEHAAQTLRVWIADGTLRRDPDPAIYVLEQVQEQGGRRLRGILGALTLSEPEWRVILPHEDVMPDPVEDRLALLTATRANLEPIFLVYDGSGGGTATIVDSVIASDAPVLTTTTTDGVTHRLWTITDANQLATIADDLRPRQALIADGHHRYTAYLRYQQERRRRDGPGPWDCALALLVDTDQTPPELSSIHPRCSWLVVRESPARRGPQVEVPSSKAWRCPHATACTTT